MHAELYELLKQREEYPDFADCAMKFLKTDEMKNDMLAFLIANPKANDEDIIRKTSELRGLKPCN